MARPSRHRSPASLAVCGLLVLSVAATVMLLDIHPCPGSAYFSFTPIDLEMRVVVVGQSIVAFTVQPLVASHPRWPDVPESGA